MKTDKETKLALQIAEAAQVTGIAQKMEAVVQDALAGSEQYADLPLEKVKELALTEPRAAEEVAQSYLNEGDASSAYPYLKTALKSGSLYGAELIEMIASNNLTPVDRKTLLLSYAVTEQYFYNNTGKLLDKIENGKDEGDIELLSEIDREVFQRTINDSMLTGFSAGKYKCLSFAVERASKKIGVRDFQNTYLLSLRLSDTPTGEIGYDDPWMYAFFIRNKQDQKRDAVPMLLGILEDAAQKTAASYGLLFTSVDVLGTTREKTYSVGADSQKISQKEAFHAQSGTVGEESVSIDVSVEKDVLLKNKLCPSCGNAVQVGQTTCAHCGTNLQASASTEKPSTSKEGIKVHIKEAVEEKALTVLSCSQCGSPIAVDDLRDGEVVVCESCGAGFLLNAKALGLLSGGIDRRRMELEKPKKAAVPDAKFAVKGLYEGRLGVIMPETFFEMSAAMKAVKYSRGTPPDLVYTDESSTVNCCFSVLYGTNVKDKDVEPAATQVLKSFKQLMPAASYGDSGVYRESGRTVHYFDCITPAADEDIYNFMIHFSLSGTLVRGSFNCLAKDRWFWGQIFSVAARSLRFSDNV